MRLAKASSGQKVLKLSKTDWLNIGERNGWELEAQSKKYETFSEIQKRYNDQGHNHHLRLKCVICGRTQTCRCSAPKTLEIGICYDCSEKNN